MPDGDRQKSVRLILFLFASEVAVPAGAVEERF